MVPNTVMMRRQTNPLTSTVNMDAITEAVIKPFDYTSTGEQTFYPFIAPPDLPDEWGIGVIVGASGTGKSTLLRNFGNPGEHEWAANKSVASHFGNADDAIAKLSAAGLSSVPEWVKPYHALSNGQQFRADLARSLHDGALIDEYTSVVDRNVAQAASRGFSRYARSNGLKNIVLSTCHRDVVPWLEPDWVMDTDSGLCYIGRWLQRPTIALTLRPADKSVWRHFRQHHYLSGDLADSAHSYIAEWGGVMVGFVAMMSFPNGNIQRGYRFHRIVTHPDYQGLGIGPAMTNAMADYYCRNGKRVFIKTSHPRLGLYCESRVDLWKPTSSNRTHVTLDSYKHNSWKFDVDRFVYSFEFVGAVDIAVERADNSVQMDLFGETA